MDLPLEVVFHWRPSSIGGGLPLEAIFHWRSFSIGGRLPLEIVFVRSIYEIWFGHISLSLKSEYDPICGC